MAVFDSILDAIGETPLIRLRRVGSDLRVPIYVKAEFLGPGGSVKDRAALSMVNAAERSGDLRPGGVIVEGTSGNTGVGLAIVAAQRGYRLIVTTPDKTSQEKLAILRALGAEVVVTNGALPRQHPDHVANLARRIAEETPGGWHANQYDNPANPGAHRTTTGPEIWRDTAGKVTHFVAGVGTGGTITGTAQFLKEASNGSVTIVGADPEHSTYGGGDGSPYFVEAVGHYRHPDTIDDTWPLSYDPTIVDRLERIGDRESFDAVGRLAREEGLLAGPSAGTALAAGLRVAAELDDRHLVVVLLPDSGRSYLSKNFDEHWLSRWGFGDGVNADVETVADLLSSPSGDVQRVSTSSTLGEALDILVGVPNLDPHQRVAVALNRPHGTTLAVGDITGSTSLAELRGWTEHGGPGLHAALADHQGPPLPTVGLTEPVTDALARLSSRDTGALVLHDGRVVGRISRTELERRRESVLLARTD
ncbi:MAG TPA: pyridoxal-phosphate dependent enzyme [Mycobacterium sp.]